MTEPATEPESPPTVAVRARDIKPYHYALWCAIEDGRPFPNEIVGVKWSEDGAKVVLWLDSHNVYFVGPDEVLDLIEATPLSAGTLRAKHADFVLGDPPKPKPTIEALQARVAELEREALGREIW